MNNSGGAAFSYDLLNRMTSGNGSGPFTYDSADRLLSTSTSAGVITRFGYAGSTLTGEYNGSNALLRRYVHGPGTDEPLVWYEGAGVTDKRYLHADERGSVVAVTNGSGTSIATNSYDDWGIPALSNIGRFGYTGQTWLPEAGLWYYKARMYSPTLGRFMQTDPIGYADGLNWYNYVGSDPVNKVDPTGSNCEARWQGYNAGVVGTRQQTNYYLIGLTCTLPSPPLSLPDNNPNSLFRSNGSAPPIAAGKQGGKKCSQPTNVNISGTISIYGAAAAYAKFSGVLTDVSTGVSYSVTAYGPGGGFALGVYDVSGTVTGFSSLDRGFSISFLEAGYGPLSYDSAEITAPGRGSIGEIKVDSGLLSIPSPIVGAGIGFGKNEKVGSVKRTKLSKGAGC